MSLTFVPRSVSRYTPWNGISSPAPSPSPPPDSLSDSEPEPERKQKPPNIDQDIAALVALALADYAIWRDPDFSSKLDADGDGFVPINYLLRRPPFRGALATEPSETEVVRALRANAAETFEVRMRLPASSSSVWYGTGKTSRKKDVGGYEVRRRDWAALPARPSRGWTHARWDALTVYIECIPPQHRSVAGIARFAESLTDAKVQAITLPPHYLDGPDDTPKCKGYALVTYSTPSDVDAVLRAWPWKRRPAPENASPAAKEAHKHGLRAISKAHWDALNEEYLRHRQSLVDAMAKTQDGIAEDALEPTPLTQTHAPPYPLDCLVFARNVHPDTNKTTLRSLFTQAFQSETGLDYVDFTKGMDTCYLRLASPRHTALLIAFFDTRPTAQADGLDTAGRTPIQDDRPISLERIQGKREQLYWEKVPEKVRRQAVDRATTTNVKSYVDHESREKKRRRER